MPVETDLVATSRDTIRAEFPIARVYKHKDSATLGMPDTSVTLASFTSWLEYKRLTSDNIHDELKDNQLAELIRLEISGHRAWVIAYDVRRSSLRTLVFRPTALRNKQQPDTTQRSTHDDILHHLVTRGVAVFEGHDHSVVVELLRRTHRRVWPWVVNLEGSGEGFRHVASCSCGRYHYSGVTCPLETIRPVCACTDRTRPHPKCPTCKGGKKHAR